MSQRGKPVPVFAALAAAALLIGCERPARDPVKLKAIKAEARTLMASHPIDGRIAKSHWPPQIASLGPEFVSINEDGVHITTRAYFDGGWGYFVPRSERDLPEPGERFEEVGQGVFWWHPY
jgi:hypothetical protein